MKRYKIRYKTVEALKNDPSYNPVTNKVTNKYGETYPVVQYCKNTNGLLSDWYTKEDPMNFWRDSILFEEIVYES
jgi:hypothetical protein